LSLVFVNVLSTFRRQNGVVKKLPVGRGPGSGGPHDTTGRMVNLALVTTADDIFKVKGSKVRVTDYFLKTHFSGGGMLMFG